MYIYIYIYIKSNTHIRICTYIIIETRRGDRDIRAGREKPRDIGRAVLVPVDITWLAWLIWMWHVLTKLDVWRYLFYAWLSAIHVLDVPRIYNTVQTTHDIYEHVSYRCLWKTNTPLAKAFALKSHSRNCSAAPALGLRKPLFKCDGFLQRSVLFTATGIHASTTTTTTTTTTTNHTYHIHASVGAGPQQHTARTSGSRA